MGNVDAQRPLESKLEQTEHLLHSQYQSWRGTPYRLGGLSRRGIDCSGFVYLTFKDKFTKSLPRTTELQAEVGLPVAKKNLVAGDLVFFKTSWKVAHVGIYLNDGFFLHASTSKGVMISNLNSPYWINSYWMARRVLE